MWQVAPSSFQVLQYLSDQFGGRVISGLVRKHLRGVRHAQEWPPRSPDMSVCDFWLFKYVLAMISNWKFTKYTLLSPCSQMKDFVYRCPTAQRATNKAELKVRVTEAGRFIQEQHEWSMKRAFKDIPRRAQLCIEADGHRFNERGRL